MAGLAGGGSGASIAYAPDPDSRRPVAADLSEAVARSGVRKDVVWCEWRTTASPRTGQAARWAHRLCRSS